MNESDVDYLDVEDPFENDEYDYKEYIKTSANISTFYLITDVLKMFIYLVIVVADVYLIVTINRNLKLKSIKSNQLIMHHSIFNIILIVSYPLFTLFYAIFQLYQHLDWLVFCLEFQLEATSVLGLFLTGFGLAFDWLITVNSKMVYPIFQKFNQNFFYFMYVLILIKIITDIIFCATTYTGWNVLVLVILIAFFIIFLLVCDCKRKSMDNRKNNPLTIANVIMLSWMPLYTMHFIFGLLRYNYTVRLIFDVLFFVPEFLAYGSPIIIMIWLNFIDKEYKMAYRNTWNCWRCNSDINYTINENADDSEDEGKV